MKKIAALIMGAMAIVSMISLWPTGASADSATTVLARSTAPVDPGTFNQATVSCPDGMVVTGGGVDIAGTDPGGSGSALTERYSGPVFGGTGWTLGMNNTGGVQVSFTVVAVCVTGTTTG